MEKKRRILVGSRAFFGEMADFKSKDHDYVVFVEKGSGFEWSREVISNGIDVFYIVEKDKQDLLNWHLSKSPIMAGKFLVPAVASELGIVIEDLKLLEPLMEKLDSKHTYLKTIFDAYMENGEMTLSQDQINAAYEVYMSSRKDDNTKEKKNKMNVE